MVDLNQDNKLIEALYMIRFQKDDVITFPDGIMCLNDRLIDKITELFKKQGYHKD